MPTIPFTLLALSGLDTTRDMLDSLAEGRKLEFTMGYTPPYEDFRGIRELQLAVQRMGAAPPEVLVIDLTEWIGHEEEEFLEITAMYLHDHRDASCIFLVRERAAAECRLLFFTLRAFLDVQMIEDRTFADREALTAYLADHYPIEAKAADRLASILMRPNARMFRSYAHMNALLSELLGRGKRITDAHVLDAVRDPRSVLHLLAERDTSIKSMIAERSYSHGKEAV